MSYVCIVKAADGAPNCYCISRAAQLKNIPDELVWSLETEHDSLLELLLRQKLEKYSADSSSTRYILEPDLLSLHLEDAEQVLSWHLEAEKSIEEFSKADSGPTMLAPSEEAKQLFLQLDALKKRLAMLECEKDFLENRIKALIGNAAGIQGVATWKTSSIKRLDSDAIKTQYPEIYSTCLKETKTRRFLLAKMA